MTTASIQALLKDRDKELMRERRTVHRKPFVRPLEVTIGRNRNEVYAGFTRDISHVGIGTILPVEIRDGTLAVMKIPMLGNRMTSIEAQARWTSEFCENWYVTGWTFVL